MNTSHPAPYVCEVTAMLQAGGLLCKTLDPGIQGIEKDGRDLAAGKLAS